MHLFVRLARRPVALALVASLALAACGEDTGASGGAPVTGHSYVTSEVTRAGTTSAAPSGTRIELTFQRDNRLIVHPGCNTISGRWSIAEGRLVVADAAMTAMACADTALMAMDTEIMTMLQARPTITVEADGSMDLVAAGISLHLVDLDSLEPPPPLEATTWTLDTIFVGDAASSVPAGLPRPVTLVIANGTFAIDDACNGVGGTWKSNGDAFTVALGPTTLIGCPEPLASLERTMSAVFSRGSVIARIERQRLTIVAPDSSGLGFVATR